MTTWIALLYSVALGHGRRVVMAELRDMAAQLGLENPRTVVATGNLLFESRMRSKAKLTRLLENGFAAWFDRHIDIILRTAGEWERLLENNPFPRESRQDPGHVTVRVMRSPAPASVLERLQRFREGDERIELVAGDPWIYFAHGIAKSRLAAALTPRRMGGAGTVRNWNTLLRIAARSGS